MKSPYSINYLHPCSAVRCTLISAPRPLSGYSGPLCSWFAAQTHIFPAGSSKFASIIDCSKMILHPIRYRFRYRYASGTRIFCIYKETFVSGLRFSRETGLGWGPRSLLILEFSLVFRYVFLFHQELCLEIANLLLELLVF